MDEARLILLERSKIIQQLVKISKRRETEMVKIKELRETHKPKQLLATDNQKWLQSWQQFSCAAADQKDIWPGSMLTKTNRKMRSNRRKGGAENLGGAEKQILWEALKQQFGWPSITFNDASVMSSDLLNYMDSRQMSEADPPTCRDNFRLLFKQVWTGLAQFFQCDQRFQEFEIVPYQPHFVRDQHTLLQGSNPNFDSVDKQVQDSMLLEHDEASRWGQLSTWKWWKLWICCQSDESTWLDEGTQYDPFQVRMLDEQKDKRLFSNNTMQDYEEKQNAKAEKIEKENIVYIDQQLFQDQKKNPESAFSEMNNDSVLELKPMGQRVNPKHRVGNVGLKRKNRREEQLKDEPNSNLNNNPYSENSKSQEVVIEPHVALSYITPEPAANPFKETLKPEQRHESVVEQTSAPKFQTQKQRIEAFAPQDRKVSEDIVYNQTPTVPVKPSRKRKQNRQNQAQPRESIPNAQDQFSQLETNLQQAEQKPIAHCKTTFIQPKVASSSIQQSQDLPSPHIKINQSDVAFPSSNPSFFKQKPDITAESTTVQRSESFAEDGMRKRKKKTMNLFNQEVTPAGELEVVEEQPPEDMVKKRRKKRRKTVLNQEKEQEERAKRRQEEQKQKEDLEVIIYSEHQEDG